MTPPTDPLAASAMDARPDREARRRGRGRPPVLSHRAVLDAAIGLLDAAGEAQLSVRAVATTLGTGVGTMYHYVSGRDELVDLATDAVLEPLVSGMSCPPDPYDAVRHIGLQLYRILRSHPWVAVGFLRTPQCQPNCLGLLDLLGQQVMPLGLPPSDTFDVVSSILSFVVGTGSEQQKVSRPDHPSGTTGSNQLETYAAAWRELDPTQYPFIHYATESLASHDDERQFTVGLELFIDGLAARASSGRGRQG